KAWACLTSCGFAGVHHHAQISAGWDRYALLIVGDRTRVEDPGIECAATYLGAKLSSTEFHERQDKKAASMGAKRELCAMGTLMEPEAHLAWMRHWRRMKIEDFAAAHQFGRRKFKTVVALPPSNDVDVFGQDLGFIAILGTQDEVAGWNVTVGGGMGMTHGEPDTYPRVADLLGFCRTKDALAVAEAVVTVQRDWGDRVNRKHARLKC